MAPVQNTNGTGRYELMNVVVVLLIFIRIHITVSTYGSLCHSIEIGYRLYELVNSI